MSVRYYKTVVGKRQIYRRVAKEVKHNLQNIETCNRIQASAEIAQGDNSNTFSVSENVSTVVNSFDNINSSLEEYCSHESIPSTSNDNASGDHEPPLVIEVETGYDIKGNLRDWALRNKIAHTALSDLLHVLHSIHPALPLEARTLLQTPTRNMTMNKLDNTKRLLHTFVGHCKKIYGLEYLIYNIHILSHLSDDVGAFGPLDSFSAFPFENFLGEVKLYIKSPKNPLIQIYRRLMKRKDTYYCEDDIKNKCTIEQCNGPLLQTAATYKQFKKLCIKNVQFSIVSHSLPNSFCLLRGNKVAQIYNIVVSENEEIFVVVKCFVSYGALFEYPFDSCHLQINLVNNFSNLEMLHISDIITKCLLNPYKDDRFVSFPLLHSS
nr:unnamed protein product [Callosobruchus analis]